MAQPSSSETALAAIKGDVVLFSEMTPPDGAEDAFNAWYDGHHTPNHVEGVPEFLSAMRYRSTAGPHYLAVYELQSLDALRGEEYRQRKYDPDEPTRNMLRSVTGFTRYIAAEGFWQARTDAPVLSLDAPVIFCVFFTVPMERSGEFNAWFDSEHAPLLLSDPGWLLARRFEIIDWDPEAYTHLILHYLADEGPLDGAVLARARATEWRRKLAAERWYKPHSVVYHRRRARFLKTGSPERARLQRRGR